MSLSFSFGASQAILCKCHPPREGSEALGEDISEAQNKTMEGPEAGLPAWFAGPCKKKVQGHLFKKLKKSAIKDINV